MAHVAQDEPRRLSATTSPVPRRGPLSRLPAGLRRPAVVLWLAAVAGLAFKWLSPLEAAYERAILADVLLAAAALARLLELPRRPLRLAAPHAWLAAYVACVGISALAAPDRTTAAQTLLIVVELAVLAALTADLVGDDLVARALGRVVLATVVFTAVASALGIALFYAGETSSLIGVYGEQFEPSERYARVAAGLATPPLLASWCIVAAAIVGWKRARLPRGWIIAAHVALVIVAAATLSRGLLGLLAALSISWAARSPSRTRTWLAVAVAAGAIVVIATLTVGRLHLDPTRPASASYTVPDPGNRREAATSSWHTLVDHPVLGKGPGTYAGTNRGAPFRAHLTPLNIAATVGIPALVAVAGLLAALWRRRDRATDIALWSGMAGVGIDALAQDVEHFRHVWLLIGLLIAGSIQVRQRA